MHRKLLSLGLIGAFLFPGHAGAQSVRLHAAPAPHPTFAPAPAFSLAPAGLTLAAGTFLSPLLVPALAVPALLVPAAVAAPIIAAPSIADRPSPAGQLRAAVLSPKDAPASFDGSGPRVAVIGGGISGLAAMHELAKLGIPARLYEAEPRLGGRVRSSPHRTGLTMDDGAELVGSAHVSVLGLMKEFKIKALRRRSLEKARTFFYEGRPYEEKAFQRKLFREAGPQLRRIARDDLELRGAIEHGPPEAVKRVDMRTIGSYLDEIAAPPILRAFVKAVVDSESGRDHLAMSSVVLFECLTIDTRGKRIAVLPDENDVFRVAGGAGKIVSALGRRHRGSASLEHRLTALESRDGKTYSLTFETPEGPKTVAADYVVMALPMPALKGIAVTMPGWTPEVKRAVDAVEFGAHQKLSLFFKTRHWRKHGHSGGGYSDEGFLFWDSSEGQPGKAGSVTFLGRASAENPDGLASRLLRQLDRAFPGIAGIYLGYKAVVWPQSYAFAGTPGDPYGYILTYLNRLVPGGLSPRPIGNFFWAGDFFSATSPAYMEGAVETGVAAVRAIARRLARRLPSR